jgi:AcrR family transcriptional regulator
MTPDANTVNIPVKIPAARNYHHGDLRAALVESGMALLEQHGAQEPGLREVARAAGVSATSVYRHFPDKDALMRAIAARGFAMMGEMQEAAALAHAGRPAFAAIGGAYVRFALKHPAVFRLMFSRAPPRDLFALPADELSGPLRLLRDNVANLTPAHLSPAARKTIAVQAWSLVHGLAVLMLDGMVTADDAMIDAVIGAGPSLCLPDTPG